MKSVHTFIITFAILINAFVCPAKETPAEINENELYSISAVLMDGDTGRILYEKNGYEQRAMASTTKIMTLILTLEYGNLEDIATVSSYAAKMPDVQLGIKKGEQYKLEDLVYSLMLESHNDSAVVIAEHIGGDVEGFADMMNKKAGELGLTHTYFITPNGIDAKDDRGMHSTTAAELARLMKYCVLESPKREEFIKICQTPSYSFTDYEGKRSFTVNNKNAFLNMMDCVIAGKTGFTSQAGYCYTAAIKNNNRTFIIALLGCGWPNNKRYKWSDSKKLFTYGIDNYNYETILGSDYVAPKLRVKNGIDKEQIDTYVKDEVTVVVSDSDKIELVTDIPEVVSAPVCKDNAIGKVNVFINDELVSSCNIYAAETVKKITYRYYLKAVFKCYFL